MGRSNIAAGLLMFAIVVLVVAHCGKNDSGQDSGDPLDGYQLVDLRPYPSGVDLLFVIDNSASMSEEQAILADQIEAMVQELVNPSDRGPETPPGVEDLHVAVITSDIGSGGFESESCENPVHGDDGMMRNTGSGEGCERSYSASDCDGGECPWLAHSIEVPDNGSEDGNPPIWEDAACLANVGTSGCVYQQPLEAALQALTVHALPGGPNEGFLRNDTIVAIFFITDGDDCSAEAPSFFDPSRHDLGAPGVTEHAM